MKGDCKVQTLALEIITPLNECTRRLSRVSTRHKHNRRGMQKKTDSKNYRGITVFPILTKILELVIR